MPDEKPINAAAACECVYHDCYQLHVSEKTHASFFAAVRRHLPMIPVLEADNQDLRIAVWRALEEARAAWREVGCDPKSPFRERIRHYERVLHVTPQKENTP